MICRTDIYGPLGIGLYRIQMFVHCVYRPYVGFCMCVVIVYFNFSFPRKPVSRYQFSAGLSSPPVSVLRAEAEVRGSNTKTPPNTSIHVYN